MRWIKTVVKLTATVSTNNLANKDVIWTITVANSGTAVTNPDCSIEQDGTLNIGELSDGDVITVKATSKADSTKYGTATVTMDLT